MTAGSTACLNSSPNIRHASPRRDASATPAATTAAVALLRPLRDAGLLPADAPLAIHAVSGYSGRGRAGVEAHEGDAAAAQPALQLYGPALDLKHVPEISGMQGWRSAAVRARLWPLRAGHRAHGAAAPRLRCQACTARRVHELLAQRYAGWPRVQVGGPSLLQAAAMQLDPEALNGSDDLRLWVFGDARGEHLLLAAVLDNLGKGAAGAALQNLSLMLGR